MDILQKQREDVFDKDQKRQDLLTGQDHVKNGLLCSKPSTLLLVVLCINIALN
jgi:hypothetical protein